MARIINAKIIFIEKNSSVLIKQLRAKICANLIPCVYKISLEKGRKYFEVMVHTSNFPIV